MGVSPQDATCTTVTGKNEGGFAWKIAQEGGQCVLHISGGTGNGNPVTWSSDTYRQGITQIDIDGPMDLASTPGKYFFGNMPNLTLINGLEKVNTARVTDMSYMFAGDSSYTSINFVFGGSTNFNTSNVTTMQSMFDGMTRLSQLIGLDRSTFNTSKVQNMSDMFAGTAFTGLWLNTPNFDTSKVENMSGMFSGMRSLTRLVFRSSSTDPWYFKTSAVKDMSNMFYNCDRLASLDVSGFDTSSVTNMHAMFFNMKAVQALDLRSFDTAHVTDMGAMFDTDNDALGISTDPSKSSLATLRWDSTKFKTDLVTDMAFMFRNCSKLNTLDVSGFNTDNVGNMQQMFYGLSGLATINVSGFHTAKVTNMSYMFNGCTNVNALDVSGFDLGLVKNTDFMFAGCWKVTTLAVEKFNTAKVTSMSGMFSDCRALTDLNVQDFKTTQVTRMNRMFSDDLALKQLNVSHFDTRQVMNMAGMFSGDRSLTNLDVSGFDTSKVIDMSSMFQGLANVPVLDVSAFDTSAVGSLVQDPSCKPAGVGDGNAEYPCGTMENMFDGDAELQGINAGSFNTALVRKMDRMFFGNSKLQRLNLSGFDMSKVTSALQMFSGDNQIKVIVLGSKTRMPVDGSGSSGNSGTDPFYHATNDEGKPWVQVDPAGTWTGFWPQMVGGGYATSQAPRNVPTTYVLQGYVAFGFLPNNPKNSDAASMSGVKGAMDVWAAEPGKSFAMPSCGYQIDGYRFRVWKGVDNKKEYAKGANYTSPDTSGNTMIKFSAQWTKLLPTPIILDSIVQNGHKVNGQFPAIPGKYDSSSSALVRLTIQYGGPLKAGTKLRFYAKPGSNSFGTEEDIKRFPVNVVTFARGSNIPRQGDTMTSSGEYTLPGAVVAGNTATFYLDASTLKFIGTYPEYDWTFTAIAFYSDSGDASNVSESTWEVRAHPLDYAPPVITTSSTSYTLGSTNVNISGTLANLPNGLTLPTKAEGWDRDVSDTPPTLRAPGREPNGRVTVTWPNGGKKTVNEDPTTGQWNVSVPPGMWNGNVSLQAKDALDNESSPDQVELKSPYKPLNGLPLTGNQNLWLRIAVVVAVLAVSLPAVYLSNRHHCERKEKKQAMQS